MCGIIGIAGRAPVSDRLVDSLRRLEYRGYDSAGIATLAGGALAIRKAQGKLKNLEALLGADPIPGDTGIGHTRWATHGPPSDRNAHPQRAGRVAVVHNGIIENFATLKAELAAEGRTFGSDTDTEVIAQLIDRELATGGSSFEAFRRVLGRLEGAYALGVVIDGEDGIVMGARRGSPLVLGYGDGEMFIGSDALAVGPFTQRVAYLAEGDSVRIDPTGARVFDAEGAPVERPVVVVPASAALVEKGEYRHFMEKEIHEQPEAVQHTLSAYIDPVSGRAKSPGIDFKALPRLQIVGLRHGLSGGPHRQVPVREAGRPALRRGDRVRIPLPRPRRGPRHAGPGDQPVGRDRRHARRAPLVQGAGAEDGRHRQRPPIHHGPRSRPDVAPACGSGDRGGLHQGLHRPARRPDRPGHRRRLPTRQDQCGRGESG